MQRLEVSGAVRLKGLIFSIS